METAAAMKHATTAADTAAIAAAPAREGVGGGVPWVYVGWKWLGASKKALTDVSAGQGLLCGAPPGT